MKEESNKKSNVLVIILIIGMIIALIFGIILGKIMFEGKGSGNKENSENTENNTNTEPNNDVKPDEKAHKSFVEKNGDYELTYSQSIYNSDFGLSMYLLSDQKSVRINIQSYAIKNIYQLNISDFTKVIKFDKKVLQIFFGGFGQAVGDEYIFFLMEDGTVEYVPFYEELSKWSSLSDSEKMNSHGAVTGVDNVVGLYGLTVDSEYSGYNSVGAARKDGTFYNLFEIIKE